jgi:AcrR family transcriptional regulator
MTDHVTPIEAGRRAVGVQEKLTRHGAILDAAYALIKANPKVLPSVQDVANAAGLAKGTLYLYFETKEAIYLGLHQRLTEAFFTALIDQLEAPKPFTLAVLLGVIDRYMIKVPQFFALGSSCMSTAIHAVEPATVQAFHQQLGLYLFRAGTLFERRLPNMNPGDGVRMLHLGYAQMLGLYQMLANSAGDAEVIAHLRKQQKQLGLKPFEVEVHTALTLVWQQMVQEGMPQQKKPASPQKNIQK